MATRLINAMVGAIVGAVAFIAVRAMIDGMSNTTWSSAEKTMWETIVPLAIAILTVASLFMGLTKATGV